MSISEKIKGALEEAANLFPGCEWDYDFDCSSTKEIYEGMIEDGYSEKDAKEWSENYCLFSVYLFKDSFDDEDEYTETYINTSKIEKNIQNLIMEKAGITKEHLSKEFELEREIEVKAPWIDFEKYERTFED